MSYSSRRFHIVIDAFNCDKKIIADKAIIKKFILSIANLVDMKILRGPIVVDGIPDNPGITAFAVIDFSHISIHTFTNTDEFCLDVFSCKSFDQKKVQDYITNFFQLKEDDIFTSTVRYDQFKIERSNDSFSPTDYLNEYYKEVGKENKELLKWYHKIYQKDDIHKDSSLLEVGGGPTIYQLISATNKVTSIKFTDQNKKNISYMKKWLKNPNDFNWSPFIAYVLGLERKEINQKPIMERVHKIKDNIKISTLNLSELDKNFCGKYDIVQSNFCCESSTDDISEYLNMLHNIHKYLKEDGIFLMSALEGSVAYKSGNLLFPAIYLDEELVKQYLAKTGFKVLSIKNVRASNPSVSKYHGFLLIKAKKSI